MTLIYSAGYQRFLVRLRQAREDARMTQEQAAAALGRRQSFLSKCESGERRVDVEDLRRFALLYRKPLSFFVDEPQPSA